MRRVGSEDTHAVEPVNLWVVVHVEDAFQRQRLADVEVPLEAVELQTDVELSVGLVDEAVGRRTARTREHCLPAPAAAERDVVQVRGTTIHHRAVGHLALLSHDAIHTFCLLVHCYARKTTAHSRDSLVTSTHILYTNPLLFVGQVISQ